MVEAMVYVLRTGCPWRDLPAQFGPWSSVYTRWSRWAQVGFCCLRRDCRVLMNLHMGGIQMPLSPFSALSEGNLKEPPRVHRGHYKQRRHRVENFFQRIKRLPRVGTRYEKLDITFFGFVCLAAVLDWLRSI